MKSLALKISLLVVLPLITASAFAAQMNYNIQAQIGAGATDVPTLSGTMLVLLSLALFAVAFKFAKQKTGANKMFVTLIGVIALSAGGSGFKLVSDANATVEGAQNLLETETFASLAAGLNHFKNNNPGKKITITGFDFSFGQGGSLSCSSDPIAPECVANAVLADPDTLDAPAECALRCTASGPQ